MSTSIKSYFRNFKKHKLIYGITIGGFAISLAVLVMIVSYIIEEKNVDKHFPNIDYMYRIKQADGNAQIPERMYQPILNAAPEIEKLCLLEATSVLYEYNSEKKWAKAVATNGEFIDIFSVDVIQGTTKDLLKAKTDVLITEGFAQRVFGDKNPLGEILEFGNNEKKEVRAIIADPLESSSLKYDVIFNLDQELFGSTRGFNEVTYKMLNAVFLLSSGTGSAETEAKIMEILKPYEGYDETLLNVQPFKDIYFDLKGDNDLFNHANLNMIKLLSWIAIIILVLAVFNYINLTTALNSERHKEICIRKTTGAKRETIFSQFLSESYLSCFIALLLAVGFAIIISPLFKDLFGREVNIFEALQNPQILLAVILIFVVIGGLTGALPALAASKYNAIDLLQRKVLLRNSNVRGVFNTIQLTVTLSLIIALSIITKQINFVKTKDVGFNKEFLLEVRLQGKTSDKAAVIKEKLLKYPNITDVTATHGRPFAIYSTSSGSWKKDSVEYEIDNLSVMNSDTSFLSAFGLEIVKGRNFRLTDKGQNVCIINKKTYDYLQLDDIDESEVFGSKIVGVVKDFHFKDMHQELGFIQLKYDPDNLSNLNIRISGNDIPGTLHVIKNTLKEFEPNLNFEPRFYDEWINTMYRKEENQAKAIVIYAVIALLLSSLGLLGLARFSAIRRTKEIGVRKVNGAKVREILVMLNSGFVKWVVIAFVIACPVAWYSMNRWLESFAYKTTLSWWVFVLSGILVLGISLLTVSWQSWWAATRNPVEALRYE
ncbi:ABC transporter permease [Maribellus maritimus]|uniref:ABC transporter permease n=1 Tax=Maribellus maritimus TaxID=2870838 RepID=UPI001EEAB0EE|nr:ABC transporter permease [Maribellus maritimus]MCG6189812.1 ABC transporter permease [Maribellus maritimus]